MKQALALCATTPRQFSKRLAVRNLDRTPAQIFRIEQKKLSFPTIR
ncbi:MAG: hypothetical protein ACAI35_15640 [Candidatus Methylacidiphilales bacterium]|nr:hypothetical protein [Candidatus Methylacidiphilales bacterium]